MKICDFSIVTLVINNISYLRHDKHFFVTSCDTALFNIILNVLLFLLSVHTKRSCHIVIILLKLISVCNKYCLKLYNYKTIIKVLKVQK